MATAVRRRSVAHDDRLSLTEHLDELRSRLIVSVLALALCFGFTFWQNEQVLEILNQPLQQTQNLDGERRTQDPLEIAQRFQLLQGRALEAQRRVDEALARSPDVSDDLRRAARAAAAASATAAAAVPTNVDRRPVTLGVAEPFTTTFSVAFYAAFLLALPFLLFQAYAFVLPAFSPSERRVALPLMLMVPLLFIAGVAFGYFVVLNRAIAFLQNFNDDDFDILIQAKDFYKFSILFVGAVGLTFQIPVGVLAVTRLGVITPQALRRNRGYVLLGMAVLAAVATPTPDPITMLLAMGPLVLLFEASIWLSVWLNRASPPGSWREGWDEEEDDEGADEDEDEEDGRP